MTEKQQGLLRKARESVKAARLLSGESMHDFAVSRAYYAMFYAAEALLAGRGLSFSKHSAVHAAFGQHFAKPGIVPVEMHRYLLDASDARTVGDYGVGPELTREDAALHIGRAEEFIRVAEETIGREPTGTG